jgi:isoleucyl-tRNA synthetase
MLKEFGLLEPLNEKEKFKIGLDLQGFKSVENMSQKEKENNQIINWIIFCEFIKEFISCISQKYKFEELIEHLFSFYSEQLDEFYNDNINDEEENENENNENKDDEGDKFF